MEKRRHRSGRYADAKGAPVAGAPTTWSILRSMVGSQSSIEMVDPDVARPVLSEACPRPK
jgi:hypothetical protein